MKTDKLPMRRGSVISNLYNNQISKITRIFSKLPAEKQKEYESKIKFLKEEFDLKLSNEN
jgi:hypothetical protein